MIRLAKIVPAVLYLLFFAQPGISQSLQVVESTFCLELKGPACFRPVVSDSVSLQQLSGVPAQIYFWSAIEVTENKNIAHVWSASNRTDSWAEPVHVSWSENLMNLARNTINLFLESLRIVYASNSSQHSVQGVILRVDRSSYYRTYSKLRAVPGTYTVQILDYDRQVVPGGEAKTITIHSSD